MKQRVLATLAEAPEGLTIVDLMRKLARKDQSFEDQVRESAAVMRAVSTLKSEHRVWPTNGKYKLTSRAKRERK